ncbi:TRAP transporter small permease [Paraglaciecola arctica]|uniref:TRAP transporter small permease n=1 Tax=Paraglaciecola arctica TaxID=1128911 RepID=UPI001C06858F|nr:TRAP transporter small permease subunit [Paraglaciecola arctica]MBU3005346.1 TRAP transporter small permease subunit [Paraglaciecola arctica]
MTLSKASEPTELKSDDDDSFEFSDVALEDWISLSLFFLLATILIAQVVSRYALNAPLGWTEEVARYQLILLSFIGASIGFRKNTHISFVYFHSFVPRRLMPICSALLSLINTLFLVFLFITCLAIVPLITSHEMSSLSLSISVLYGLLGLCLALCLLRSAIRCANDIKRLFLKSDAPDATSTNTPLTKDP